MSYVCDALTTRPGQRCSRRVKPSETTCHLHSGSAAPRDTVKSLRAERDNLLAALYGLHQAWERLGPSLVTRHGGPTSLEVAKAALEQTFGRTADPAALEKLQGYVAMVNAYRAELQAKGGAR